MANTFLPHPSLEITDDHLNREKFTSQCIKALDYIAV
jgi:hypothetical protein